MSNIISNTISKEFGDLVESFETDIISVISNALKEATDMYVEKENELNSYVNHMKSEVSSKFPMSNKYINVEEMGEMFYNAVDGKFSVLSDKIKSLRGKYINYVLQTDKDTVIKDSLISSITAVVSEFMSSYVSYLENLKECYNRYIVEINLYRSSSSSEDYNYRLESYYSSMNSIDDDLVLVDGELVIYVERDLNQLVKLLESKGYKVLLLGDKYCIYFREFSINTIPTTIPILKSLQCEILKKVQL